MSATEQIASNHSGIIEALKLIIASGIGASIVGGIMKLVVDRKLADQQAKHNQQLEGLKSELEKKNTVHKLQFEKEFRLYSIFWRALIDVRRSINITPILDYMPPDRDSFEVYKERWKGAAEKFNKAIDILDYRKPFFHDDVSEPAGKLLGECKSHLIKLEVILTHHESGKDLEMYEKSDNMAKMISEAIDKLDVIIKKRIGLLQEATLIE